MEESSKPLILVWPTLWEWEGGKDCPVLTVYKNFILQMISYYGGFDIHRNYFGCLILFL